MTELTGKPIHAKPSLYAFYFEVIKEIGYRYGYNIVLHGSMNRDLDLIAIPWQEVIGDKKQMLSEIETCIGGKIINEDEKNIEKFRNRFHGREAYIININRGIKLKNHGMVSEILEFSDPQYYIDISILPTI